MPKGNAEMIQKDQTTKTCQHLVYHNRFPEGVPAVGPRADTKVVGCLLGGKIVRIKTIQSGFNSIFLVARFNEIKTASLCRASKGDTKTIQKGKNQKMP